VEPLLEDLGKVDLRAIDWMIVGGESGNGARPMHKDWVVSLRDQCRKSHVRFFFKQWAESGKRPQGANWKAKLTTNSRRAPKAL